MACARLGVNFVGADLDEGYLEEAVERVQGVAAGRELLPGRGTAKMRKAELRPTASSKVPKASGA